MMEQHDNKLSTTMTDTVELVKQIRQDKARKLAQETAIQSEKGFAYTVRLWLGDLTDKLFGLGGVGPRLPLTWIQVILLLLAITLLTTLLFMGQAPADVRSIEVTSVAD